MSDDDVTQRIFATWSSVLSNSFLPRRLRPLLRDTGFATVRVEAIPIVNAGYSEHSFSAGMLQNMADTAERHGRISADEARDWLAGLEQLQRDDAYFFCVNRFLFTAVK